VRGGVRSGCERQHDGRYPANDDEDDPDERQAATPFASSGLLEEEVCIGRVGGTGHSGGSSRLLTDNGHDATIIGVMSSVKVSQDDDEALALSEVDRSDPMPLHDQVAAEIRRAIADGEAHPGDRIPQAKDLAAVLGVNTNTVLRALRVLRDEGLLELGRGRAIIVAGTPERGAVVGRLKEFLAFARTQGYQREEVLAMMESLP
jgi:GntR family transcriptional regulator